MMADSQRSHQVGVALGDIIEELVEWNWIDDVIVVVLYSLWEGV